MARRDLRARLLGLNMGEQERYLFSLASSVVEEEVVALPQDLRQSHPHLPLPIEFSFCLKQQASSSGTSELVSNHHRDLLRLNGQLPCVSFSLYSIQRSRLKQRSQERPL